MKGIAYFSLALCVLPFAAAAEDSSATEEVTVVATRVEQSIEEIPAAVSVLNKDDIQRGRQLLGLDESLTRVPGVFAQNRYNFSQDLRVSIRGFGARANFGIRGLKIYADGIPSTTADGQSGIDDIDLGSVGRVEVIRGPSSALYGASSGGVINLISEDGPAEPFVQSSVTAGEDGHRHIQVKAGGQADRLNYMVSASDLGYDGYRDHSRVDATQFNSKFRYDINNDSDLSVIVNYVDSPKAQDSGGITAAQVDEDPKQAQERNLSSNADETLEQEKLGLLYNRRFGDGHEMTVKNYYVWRDFTSYLPIGSHIAFVADDGVVEFDRFFYGGGIQFNFATELFDRPNQVIVGIDIDMQKDDRQRFINNAGVKGALSFDQIEEAKSYGLFVRNDLQLTDDVNLIVGARFDQLELNVDDKYLANADQSSSLDFDEVSPMLGVVWRAADNLSLYANYGTSFETPTFTELAEPARELAVSLGGFNNVKAQKAQSFEVGLRGSYLDNRIYVDVAAFSMTVDDEITNVANIGNRANFENADTDRRGVEISANARLLDGLQLNFAYTYSDFEFDKFPTEPQFNGNKLPGLPDHQVFAEVVYDHPTGIFIAADVLYIDELQVDNANNSATDSSVVANFRAGHVQMLGRWQVTPFVGVNNLTNEKYMSNLRINGFGGRLFEPGPERNWYGGVTVDFAL